MGSQIYIREPCALCTPLAEKFWHTPKYLPIPIIAVKFHLRSSITCDLWRAISRICFALKGPPKWGCGVILGVGIGENIFYWESTVVFRIARFQTSLVKIWHAGPGSSILYGYSHLPLAKIWTSLGVPSSPTRSRRKTPLPEDTLLDLQLSHGKIGIILQCNPWAVGLSPEGIFYAFFMGKIGQNPKIGQLWSPVTPQP